ncbi:CRISPR-associated protein, Csn1 family [Desulfovibrio sp. DV]|uniref:type II CRISPR RNA-guided endonuclease Cas9 n=1 Tax=Desulfovibrio sp. DV TaxID=1844708 RepID=UPI00094BC3CE|nr:type II CRISPR RNA-guided endonuclease Cas9 [Desulfovibrio sp. DV]OLN24895.1 CRISPR-associated protein, Csn1 family [Desulfovibrio sp. DV]
MSSEHIPYRLSLDLGTNSIGWCMLKLLPEGNPGEVINMGVRIFSDGRDAKSGKSLAEDRRLARQARRRRDRFLKRRKELLKALIGSGLMPPDERQRKQLAALDPYLLRTKALDARLEPFELGRALFHLNQRRGFKSNRKTDKDQESGKIKAAIARLTATLQESGTRTLGEYLHNCRQAGRPIRFRPIKKGAGVDYALYPQRSLAEAEFDAIIAAQRPYHPQLDAGVEGKGGLRDIIFYQRPLKPVDPGLCTLMPLHPRAPLALPTAQRFRILQDLNHLRVLDTGNLAERLLTLDERNTLLVILETGKDLSFDAIRVKLGLPPSVTFNLDTGTKDGIKGDVSAKILSGKKLFGKAWASFSREIREDVVERLIKAEDEEELVAELVSGCSIDPAKAAAVAQASLPSGYARFCRETLAALCEQLERDVIPYSEAVVRAGFKSHSDLSTGEVFERLPYYGIALPRSIKPGSGKHTDPQEVRLGRISNPTVHIALNQLRKVVNELIKDHGKPAQIIVEVARDLKNGPAAMQEIRKRQKEGKDANDRRRTRLVECGVKVTADALLRLRLWEDLGRDETVRRCPYTGDVIGLAMLLSDEVEIDHILPFSRSLDDSPTNKTVCLRRANRYKLNRTPAEAFGDSRDGYSWEGVMERAARLSENKCWRFAPDAMERLEREADFLDRQLVDTQYIGRIAGEYLACICDKRRIWVTPGRLTRLLAHAWGFPKKNRNDHRHHALDAVLIGVCDRSLLKKVADHNAREVANGLDRFLADLEQPWPGFRDEALAAHDRIIVSHRPDHGLGGRLHNDTAYGILNLTPKARNNAQHRVSAETLSKPRDLLKIKGRGLRARLIAACNGMPLAQCLSLAQECEGMAESKAEAQLVKALGDLSEKQFKEKVHQFFKKNGIRRLRLVETIRLTPIHNAEGTAYKGFKTDSNAYYPIYLHKDGSWHGTIISTFEANNQETANTSETDPLITKLFNGDMIEINNNSKRIIAHIVKQSAQKIVVAEHFEANLSKRSKSNEFKYICITSPESLRKCQAKPLYVSPTGKVTYMRIMRHADPGDRRL